MKSVLMIGQSNMAGRGNPAEVEPLRSEKLNMLFMGKFIRFVEPSVYDESTNRIWRGITLASSFANECAEYFNEDIGMIPCAFGGSSLDEWKKGELFFDNAVMMTTLALRQSTLSAIIWHQGEADSCAMELSKSYYTRFMSMINSLKEKIGVDVPVVVGEVGRFLIKDDYPYAETVNDALHKIGENKGFGCASSEGLKDRGDKLHFDAKSCRLYGERYFEEFKKFIRIPK